MDLETFSAPPEKSFSEKLKDYFIEFFQSIVVIGAIFALIYLFVAQFHKVSGSSMVPTFQNGDFLVTEKVSYKVGSPQRGDIIVLKNPRDESVEFIKRIVAIPDDTIMIEENSVFINGERIEEPYLAPGTPTPPGEFLANGNLIRVGANQYFVFGDNRSHSSDSREWGGVSRKEIVGKAFFRYWPPGTLGLLSKKSIEQ